MTPMRIRVKDETGKVVYQAFVSADDHGIVFPKTMPPLKPDWSLTWETVTEESEPKQAETLAERLADIDTVTSLLIDRVAALERGEPPPRDWMHRMAELEERLTRRLSLAEERVGITRDSAPESPQADVQVYDVRCPDCGKKRSDELMRRSGFTPEPSTVPDGVVPPHVRRNLDALAQWTSPDRWTLEGDATNQARTRAMLDHLHGLVMRAMAGEDVPLQ